jgi:abhydrolase domain-containing protein 6
LPIADKDPVPMRPTKPLPVDRPLWKQLLLRRFRVLAVMAGLVLLLGGGTYLLAPQYLMQLQSWVQAERAHLDTRYVQVGDTHWAYYEGGKGPVMVLLHGYGGSRHDWLKVAPKLTRNFHVIIPDLPGWGDSTRLPDADYDIDAQAARLAAFVKTLNLPHFVLVGHSMGGAIAGVYAAEHPQQVSGLALMDSFGLTFKENAFARQALAGDNPFLFSSRAGFKRMARLVFKQPPDLPGRFIDVLVKRNERNRAFLQKVFRELNRPDQYTILDAHLGQLTMQVVGIWCADDKVIDKSALNTLRSGLTQAASIGATVINGCGHVPELEKPDETAQILASFAVGNGPVR